MTDLLLGWPTLEVVAVAVGFFVLELAADKYEARP